MFDDRLIPENVLNLTVRDLKSSILRVKDSGFPQKSIPPHACAILISTEKTEDGSEDVLLSRSMPISLDTVENSLWIPYSFFMFENAYYKFGSNMVAVFLGFVDENGKYASLLVSKDAEEAIGAVTGLDMSKEVRLLGRHPAKKYPFLFEISYYSKSGSAQEEAH